MQLPTFIRVVLAIALLAFIGLATAQIKNDREVKQIQKIEIKSNEAKLIELDNKYNEVLELKSNTEAEKQEQQKKIEELESERERLERELQAKLHRQAEEKKKLAEASKKATGTQSVSASSKTSGTCEDWMRQAGIVNTEATRKLILKESGCNPRAVNPSSGAFGIPQAYPASKIAHCGVEPVCQLRWMDTYIKGRYGSWDNALSMWYSRCGSPQGCWY